MIQFAQQRMGNTVAAMAAVLPFFWSSAALAEKPTLPDINSGIPIDEITFPLEAWDPVILTLYEIGPKYLSRDEVFDVPPPPANSSAETKAEIETLKAMIAQRDEATIAAIHRDNAQDAFAAIIEAHMIPANTAASQMRDVLRDAVDEVGFFILREKKRFGRARPVQLAPDLAPVIETPAHASYPSGHAAQAYAAGYLLALADSPQDQRYLGIAVDVGKRREIAGVHYASDTKAGIDLALQVVVKLLENDEFLTKFEAAQKTFIPLKPQ